MACRVERHAANASAVPESLFRRADAAHIRGQAALPPCRETRRGEALIALEELAECIPSDWSMEKSVENRELIRAFNAFLSSLPPRERNLFVARYWYGLPVDELAVKFGLNKNTALSKLRRTRLRLLEYLEKEGLK